MNALLKERIKEIKGNLGWGDIAKICESVVSYGITKDDVYNIMGCRGLKNKERVSVVIGAASVIAEENKKSLGL